jgi:hypothetical protein
MDQYEQIHCRHTACWVTVQLTAFDPCINRVRIDTILLHVQASSLTLSYQYRNLRTALSRELTYKMLQLRCTIISLNPPQV